MEKFGSVDRQQPRGERAADRLSMDGVLKVLAKKYGVKMADLMKGKRGNENQPKKVWVFRK